MSFCMGGRKRKTHQSIFLKKSCELYFSTEKFWIFFLNIADTADIMSRSWEWSRHPKLAYNF